ncbi:MAG: TAXI family TRAP transporter solute-binding subunit [Natronospirillum sp.]
MRLLLTLLLAGVMLASASAQTPTTLTIATGGVGGVYYPIGVGLGGMIERHVEGYTGMAEVTGASVENMRLIAGQDSDMALALADTVVHAYSGQGVFADEPMTALRALGSVYPNAIQIVTLEGSGIDSLQDLKGRRVSVGAEGSGTEVSARSLLQANGISYSDLGTAERLNFTETAEALRDGDIDVGFWSVGPPTSSITELANERAISLLNLSEQEMERAIAAEPTLAPHRVLAGTYQGVNEQTLTLGTPNVLVVNQAMSEDLAYNLTKTLFERVRELRNVHSVANSTTPTFSVGATPIPMHPGAARYYEELGFSLRDDLQQGSASSAQPTWSCRVVTWVATLFGCDCV